MGQLEEIISEGGESLGETNILLEDEYFFFSDFFFFLVAIFIILQMVNDYNTRLMRDYLEETTSQVEREK